MQVSKILIVDDDPEDREFFTIVIKQIDAAIEVKAASNRNELFRHLAREVPHLLFIDSFIQHESGHTSIAEIRANARFNNLPIIMYTGSAEKKNIAMAFESGATAYVVKPHSLAEIQSVLQQIIHSDWTEASSWHKQYYLDGKFRGFIN
ncbi:MAG TPA: response regulator [Chitinophagaceae bacterium]|nr:response regulator [Chitinophagaceae bacterium]